MSGLVVREARRITSPATSWFDDLVQVGEIALWREGPRAVRWRMLDWLRAWRGQASRDHHLRDAPLSLDAADDESDVTLGESLPDDALDPADVVVARDTWRRLSSRERTLLSQACGGWTLDDQAEARGVTRSRACQLRQQARSSINR